MRLATLKQTIKSTTPATPSSITNTGPVRVRAMLWPRAPGSTAICRARNFVMISGGIAPFNGASTSLMIPEYSVLSAACACSKETPGFSRPNA